MASLAPLTTVPSTGSSQVGDKQVEELLSEKLLEGYALLDTACPKCVTPLVKRKSSALSPKMLHRPVSSRPTSPYVSMSTISVQVQPSGSNAGSIDANAHTFHPVSNVPICVSCQAHVVTCQADIDTLESANVSMKDRGSIIVAMEDEDVREEFNVASPTRIAEKSFFPTSADTRDSPESINVQSNASDKENGGVEEVVVVQEKPVLEPVDPPVEDEEDVSVPAQEEEDDSAPAMQEEEADDSAPVHEEEEDSLPVQEEDVSEDSEDSSPLLEEEESEEDSLPVQEEETPIQDTTNSIVVEEEEMEETIDKYDSADDTDRYDASAILARQTSPSVAAFLCASTASYQYVVPSPIPSPKSSFVEEEGFEQNLEEHTRCMEQVGSEAAFAVLLPPKPQGSDLLQADEKEELDQERQALSPHAKRSPRAHHGNESDVEDTETFEDDEVMQEYSVR